MQRRAPRVFCTGGAAAASPAALARLPADERGTSELIHKLALMLEGQGKLDEAESLFREAVRTRCAEPHAQRTSPDS